MKILTLCTGNVARSVMHGFMLETLAETQGWEWEVRTAGTFAIENQAMSSRTLTALQGIEELGDYEFTLHRSRQITDDDVAWADASRGARTVAPATRPALKISRRLTIFVLPRAKRAGEGARSRRRKGATIPDQSRAARGSGLLPEARTIAGRRADRQLRGV